MPNITTHVSQELKKKMEQHEDINWSAVTREAIQKKLAFYDTLKAFSKDSTLTEEDAITMGRALKKQVWEKHYRKRFEKLTEKQQQVLKKN